MCCVHPRACAVESRPLQLLLLLLFGAWCVVRATAPLLRQRGCGTSVGCVQIRRWRTDALLAMLVCPAFGVSLGWLPRAMQLEVSAATCCHRLCVEVPTSSSYPSFVNMSARGARGPPLKKQRLGAGVDLEKIPESVLMGNVRACQLLCVALSVLAPSPPRLWRDVHICVWLLGCFRCGLDCRLGRDAAAGTDVAFSCAVVAAFEDPTVPTEACVRQHEL